MEVVEVSVRQAIWHHTGTEVEITQIIQAEVSSDLVLQISKVT